MPSLSVLAAPVAPPRRPRQGHHYHHPRHGRYPLFAGRVIVGGERGTVRAYGLRDGELLWERRGAGITAAPPLTLDGLLLAERGALVLLDPRDGRELQRLKLEGEVPRVVVVTDHGTYVLTEADRLLALRQGPR